MIDNALCLSIIVDYTGCLAVMLVDKRTVQVMRDNPKMFSQTRGGMMRDLLRRIDKREEWGEPEAIENCLWTVQKLNNSPVTRERSPFTDFYNSDEVHLGTDCYFYDGEMYLSVRKYLIRGDGYEYYLSLPGKTERVRVTSEWRMHEHPADMMRYWKLHRREFPLPPNK